MWDENAAVAALDAAGGTLSQGLCAEYTRKAIEAGGVLLVRHTSAKDYGSSLIAVGFAALATDPGVYQAGDVGIVQPIAGHPDGHMAMYDGTIWVSDFKQQHGLYPGPGYRVAKPPFTIYRYPST
ncbi:MAG: hypothetical protein ABI197_13065 [Granulicella sp.]